MFCVFNYLPPTSIDTSYNTRTLHDRLPFYGRAQCAAIEEVDACRKATPRSAGLLRLPPSCLWSRAMVPWRLLHCLGFSASVSCLTKRFGLARSSPSYWWLWSDWPLALGGIVCSGPWLSELSEHWRSSIR